MATVTNQPPQFTLRSALDDVKPKLSPTQLPAYSVPVLSFAAPQQAAIPPIMNTNAATQYPASQMQSAFPTYEMSMLQNQNQQLQMQMQLLQQQQLQQQEAQIQQQRQQQQSIPPQPTPPSFLSPQTAPLQTAPSVPFQPAHFQADHMTVQNRGEVDRTMEPDMIRAAYSEFIIAPIATEATPTLPHCLVMRGLDSASYSMMVSKVREMKRSNNLNKGLLWGNMIFWFGIIGYILCAQRAIGNKRLRSKLSPVLHEANTQNMNKGVNVRYVWLEGELRVYYK